MPTGGLILLLAAAGSAGLPVQEVNFIGASRDLGGLCESVSGDAAMRQSLGPSAGPDRSQEPFSDLYINGRD